MGRSSNKEINLGNFDITEDGTVKNCPEGKEPVKTGKKKNRYTATAGAGTQGGELQCDIKGNRSKSLQGSCV